MALTWQKDSRRYPQRFDSPIINPVRVHLQHREIRTEDATTKTLMLLAADGTCFSSTMDARLEYLRRMNISLVWKLFEGERAMLLAAAIF